MRLVDAGMHARLEKVSYIVPFQGITKSGIDTNKTSSTEIAR